MNCYKRNKTILTGICSSSASRSCKEAMTLLARAWDGPDSISSVECWAGLLAGMLSEMLSGRSCVTQVTMGAALRNLARQTADTGTESGYLQQVIAWQGKQRTLAQCLVTYSK